MAGQGWCLVRDDKNISYMIEKSPTILGCNNACDIIVDDPSVSRQHLQFVVDGKSLVIHKLTEISGVFMDGRPVQSKMFPIGPVYNLQVGNVSFRLYYQKSDEPSRMEDGAEVLEPESNASESNMWYYSSKSIDHGPLTDDEIFAAVDRGDLLPTDDVWNEGMEYRVKACEVQGLFDSAPPSCVSSASVADNFSQNSGSMLCPYCWNRFNPEDVLFIAGHPDFIGDPILGDEPQRFLPTRFTPEGVALDAAGVACPDMACPRCHMRIPSALQNQPPLFMSIVGAPTSGKSYFLASSIWRLRINLPKFFNIRFMDVDAVTNHWLNDYEEKMFFQSDLKSFQTIAKTQIESPTVYRQILLNNMQVSIPLPSLFSLQMDDNRPCDSDMNGHRTLVLYDNAGEHFLAGADSIGSPGTKHLLHAEGILFFFDPTVDPRFRTILKPQNNSPFEAPKAIYRQDILLVEMIGRIRKHMGLSSLKKIDKPVIVGISKADLLAEHLSLDADPWVKMPSHNNKYILDLKAIREMSNVTRGLLEAYAPEIIATVESFAEHVVYLPNSALGHNPAAEGIRPGDINPRWVEVPLLYILYHLGYISSNMPMT